MTDLSLNMELIRHRVNQNLEEKLVPLITYKIKKKIEESKALLLEKYGDGKRKEIDDFLTICKDELLSRFNHKAITAWIESEVHYSIDFVSSGLNNQSSLSGQEAKKIDFDPLNLPSIQDFFNPE